MFYRLMLRDERFGEATFTDTPLSKSDAEGLAESLNSWLKERLGEPGDLDDSDDEPVTGSEDNCRTAPLTVRVVSELDFPVDLTTNRESFLGTGEVSEEEEKERDARFKDLSRRFLPVPDSDHFGYRKAVKLGKFNGA